MYILMNAKAELVRFHTELDMRSMRHSIWADK